MAKINPCYESVYLYGIERLWQDIKVSKLFTQTHKALEDMQAIVPEILQNYCDAAIAKLTQFSHFIDAANAL